MNLSVDFRVCADARDALIDAIIHVVPKNDFVVELFVSLGGMILYFII